jgi:hypothetical protein
MRGELSCRRNVKRVSLAGCWWPVLICSERKVLLAGCWWLVCSVGFHVEVHCSSRAVGCGLCTLHLEISSQEFACNLGVFVKKKREREFACDNTADVRVISGKRGVCSSSSVRRMRNRRIFSGLWVPVVGWW